MPWFEDESLPELAPVEPPCAPEDEEPPVEPEPPVTDELPSAPVPDDELLIEPDDEPPCAPDEPALDAPPDAPVEPVLAEPDSDEPLMLEFDEPEPDDDPSDDEPLEPLDDDPIDDDNPDEAVPAPPLAPLDEPLRPPLLPAPLLEPVDGLALCDEPLDRLPDEALLLLFRLLDLSSLPMLLPLLLASTPFPSLDF